VTLDSGTKADFSTDLKLSYVFQRRGLALETANLMTFENHQKLNQLLLGEFLRTPPTGYARVSIEQMHNTDREIWRVLSQKCRAGVKPNPDGTRPLDVHIDAVLADPTVRMLLMPLQLSKGGALTSRPRDDEAGVVEPQSKRAKKRANAKAKQVEAQRYETPSWTTPKGKGKGKGKGKDKGKRQWAPRMPPQLIGKAHETAAGEAICFDCNLPQGCSKAAWGQKCPKGLHVCCEPGCFKHHACVGNH
jgi:hypothetical protein